MGSFGQKPVCFLLDDDIAPIDARDNPAAEPGLIYEYRPLKEARHIRILQFSRRQGSDYLVCDLIPVSLDDAPEFFAVSYCWGMAQEQSGLVISGNNHISISNVVKRMLQRLIGSRDSMALWIDAICINQADNVEKSTQVSMMGDIYSTATGVLAWLGDCDDENIIVQWMSRVYAEPSTEHAKIGLAILGSLNKIKLQRALSAEEQTVLRMLNMPWFSRTWVIQEACLARSLMFQYGRCSFSWPFLLGVLSSVSGLTNMSSSFIYPDGRLCEA